MRLMTYKDLVVGRHAAAFERVRAAIEADDFRTADVKKLHAGRYYRARLDRANRLLLSFVRIQNAGGVLEKVCLALEVIENHAYDRSRFLRGAPVDESKIEQEGTATAEAILADAEPLPWLGRLRASFEMLDKPLVFDDVQQALTTAPLPLVIIGPAGSGKTAVTLSRLRELPGRIWYVTQSAYLARNAQALHAAHGFDNPDQDASFLSFREFLETIAVPEGRELRFSDFREFCTGHSSSLRRLGIEANALFEEFRGVIGAAAEGPLTLAQYEALGVRQSLLPVDLRATAHALFERYRGWLQASSCYDPNLVAHAWRTRLQAIADPSERPSCDFLVVDEVQDLTPVQLRLLLDCLARPGQFLLCGDSHQIVHPNFFSWSALKEMFWRGLAGAAAERQNLSVLLANYRNTRKVTTLANRLLQIKQLRFGSVDRESTYLVEPATDGEGEARLLDAQDPALQAMAAAVRQSVAHAVLVLRDEDKPAARDLFRTPLVFSVHEAKGLEYPHVLLYGLVSSQRQTYAEICESIDAGSLDGASLEFRRARDRNDRSLELYKFYINALYVAITRARESVTLVEHDCRHPLLSLLGLQTGAATAPPVQVSSREAWAQEARKLELQGKVEQAQAIRESILKHAPIPWTAWDRTHVENLLGRALDPRSPGAKPRQAVLDYALFHGQQRWILDLARQGFAPAQALCFRIRGELHCTTLPPRESLADSGWLRASEHARRAVRAVRDRLLRPYETQNVKEVLRAADLYGIDHRTPAGGTPLMLAARAGNPLLVDTLLDRGADAEATDEFGQNAWQQVLCRALHDPEYASRCLPQMAERLAPACLDLEVDGRLIRLERRQGEYWLLSIMLAGLKSFWSSCEGRKSYPNLWVVGYAAAELSSHLAKLPNWLWHGKRDPRYVGAVLARAERHSNYRPARRLWQRMVTGRYLPNPELKLRIRTPDGNSDGWQPVYSVMALDWIAAGCIVHVDLRGMLLEKLQPTATPAGTGTVGPVPGTG